MGIVKSEYFPEAPSKPETKEVRKEEIPNIEKIEKKVEKEAPKVAKENLLPVAKAIPMKEVSVETQDYLAIFTSDGAKLKHFRLKKYLDRVEESAITLRLIEWVKGILGSQAERPKPPEPLDLVNTDEGEGLPLGVVIDSNPTLSAGNGK